MEEWFNTPEGKKLIVQMADDLLYYREILPETSKAAKESMIKFMREKYLD